MTETYQNANIDPRLLIDPDAIASRLETLDDASLCDSCRNAVIPVAADTVRLLIETIRLRDALSVIRLESANRLAAIRAALRAADDNETDPLAYLRDQLDEEATDDPASGL